MRQPATALPVNQPLPAQDDFRHRKIALESFSSISQRMIGGHGRTERAEVFSLIDENGRDNDEPVTGAAPEAAALLSADDMPGGAGMGSMFHSIFENIDFQAVMNGPADILEDDQIGRVVESAIARYRIDMQWAPSIGRIVARSLRHQIAVDDTMFSLGQLTPAQRRHEIEFYFPLSGLLNEMQANKIQQSDLRRSDNGPGRDMVVRGFIDLVFTWQDRFYIADWKSNRLPSGYHQDAMSQEMEDAGYNLQYQLYSLSTLRWLRQRLGDRFDPQRHFGGVFYLFIRGMGAGGAHGVLHITPEQLLPFESLEERIRRKIAGIQWQA
jgi:exodeoxyribonuclease V beta subunit